MTPDQYRTHQINLAVDRALTTAMAFGHAEYAEGSMASQDEGRDERRAVTRERYDRLTAIINELRDLALGATEPEEGAAVICADPDCGAADCTGDHGLMRCPSTGQVNRNLATVADRWTCCGGLYPDHTKEA